MVKKKKKESQAKVMTNKAFFETEELEPQEEFELEKEEIKAVRRYIG